MLNCALFNAFCVYRTLTSKKVRYKNFLHEVARSWISEVQIRAKSNSDDLQMPEKQTTPRGPKLDPPGRHQAEHTSWEKLLLVGRGIKSTM